MARSPDFEGEQSKVTSILRAIGNTKRLRILNELSDGQERSVSELENIIATLKPIGFIATSRSIATRQHRANTPRVANDLLFN